MQKMLLDVPGTGAGFERIHVKPGPWAADLSRDSGWAYFPDDSLVGLSPSRPALGEPTIAVVGHRGFWFSGAQLQAQVLRGGHLYRLDWALVQGNPQRYAPWLISAAEASQRLIRQMTQMAFCANHHTPIQCAASWLLVCLHQASKRALPIRLGDIPSALGQPGDAFQAALGVLDAHWGIHRDADLLPLPGQDVMSARPWTLDPAQLSRLACNCHRRINEEASV